MSLPKLFDAPVRNTDIVPYMDRLMNIKQWATDVLMYKFKFYETNDLKYVRRVQRCVKAIDDILD